MGARLSWKTYDTMRTTLGLEKKDAVLGTREYAKIKKTHGYKDDHFESIVDATSLLLEARSWMPTETINWSDLDTRYGLSTSNRGQIVKEYLAMHHIPNAMTSERPSRQPRRAKVKFPGGKISQPMFKPSMMHKKEIERKIIDGEINIGIPITPIQCTTYKIDNDSKIVIEETSTIHGHHITMIGIRHTLLNRHETL